MKHTKDSLMFAYQSIIQQDLENYDKSKEFISKAIDKISKVLINENSSREFNFKKDILLECYSMYERIKNTTKDKYISICKDKVKDKAKSVLIEEIVSYSSNNKLTNELNVLNYLQKTIDAGYLLTPKLFIRKEIWAQTSAKISFITQKHEAISIIYNRVDGLITLCNGNVIVLNNFERFIDIMVDIQNSFANELSYIKPQDHQVTKEVISNTFQKKFSDISAKLRTSLFSLKLSDKPDYIELLNKTLHKVIELDSVYSSLRKSHSEESLDTKMKVLCNFLFNFLIKLLVNEMHDLTLRFLKKKFLSFENK